MHQKTYQDHFNQLIEQYTKKPQPHVFLQAHTVLIKKLLASLWQEHLNQYPHLALLATGGFGRNELYPYSDIDLAIISPLLLTKEEETAISTFIRILWDYKLCPAPKSGSKEQLLKSAQDDITADTAFLESVHISGNRQLSNEFLIELHNQRDNVAFCEAKILEQEQRHIKERTSLSSLEPNIKTCPGGLRDIHTLIWLAKAQGIPITQEALVTEKVLTKDEVRLLFHSHKQLARLRIDLHLLTKREEDFFVFDMQTQIAGKWGFKDTAKKIKSEQIMQVFFRAQKTVKQLNLILAPILRARLYSPFPQKIIQIDEQFFRIGTQLSVHDFKLFEKQPSYIFKALSIIQINKEIKNFSPKCLRAIWNARKKINNTFQENPENTQAFIDFFLYGDGLTHTLRFMNLFDFLGRYLPNWGKIVGLMQYDLFHIYPVDDHILMVVRNLRRMSMEIHNHELPFLSGLMISFKQKHILYLAALFHDIAKGRGGDHAKLGAEDAKDFAQTHFLNEEETDLLCWLVRAHLLMSQTAQKEDIQDKKIIERFAKEVKTPARLVALYLLTCADMRATNPKIWNSWKASLLNNLYQLTLDYLNQDNTCNFQTDKDSIVQLLIEQGFSRQEQKKIWAALGEAYIIRHQKNDIIWHVQNLIGKENEPQVYARVLPNSQTLQIMVYTFDQSGVFAKICQFITQSQLNIVDAKIYTTEHNFVLDTFIVQNIDLSSEALHSLSLSLPKALYHHMECCQYDATKTGRIKTSRRLKSFPIEPQITLLPQERAHFYSLEIIAGDYSGILEQVGQVLNQFNIRLYHAKIMTLGDRIEDSFLIASSELEDARFQLKFKESLFNVLKS